MDRIYMEIRKKVFRSSYLLAALFLPLFASQAWALENHGLLSVEDYYADDTDSGYYQHFLSTRIKTDTEKMGEDGSFAAHFDGRQRTDLGSSGYKSQTKTTRIDTLYLDYTGKSVYLAVGRLWPKEFYIEHIDGVNAVYQGKNLGAGVFAGLKPDPYTDGFNSSYSAAGAYMFFHHEKFSSTLGFVHNAYKGGTDRQYVYAQANFTPIRQIYFYTTLTADLKQDTKKVSLTNVIAELSYRPDYNKSITVGYNQFRAFRYYKSMDFVMDDSKQQSYYVLGNYRIKEKYNFYARYERQTRYYPSIERRFRKSDSYRVGVNVDNLLSSGVMLDVSAALATSYGSKHKTYNIEISRLNWEVLQLVLTGSYNQYANVSVDNVWTFGAAGYLFLYKKWNFSLAFDREQGRYYTINRVMSRVAYKF